MSESHARDGDAYASRFAEYYRRLGISAAVLNGTLWLETNRMAFPYVPARQDCRISRADAKRVLALLPRAMVLRCTDGFHEPPLHSEWYAVICREFLRVEDYDAKRRSEIRRGLRNCEVRRVDAEYLAQAGYEVHLASSRRYGQDPKSRERFQRNLIIAGEFGDVIDFWVVLYKSQVVGYAQNHLFGATEVNYSGMAFDPACFTYYPSYALVYRMNEYYLDKSGFAYVNDGYRTLWHPTEFQQFLVRKFNFERMPTRLYVYYRWPLGWIMSLPRRLRTLGARLNRKFAALNTMHEARYAEL